MLAERNHLTPVSVTESAVVSQAAWNEAGQTPMNKRDNLAAAAQEASAAGEAQVRNVVTPSGAWPQHSALTEDVASTRM